MNMHSQKPYDYFEAMERLRTDAPDMTAEERERLKAKIALNASDPYAVSLTVDITGDDWAHIYPEIKKAERISTGAAIDTFLNTYGKSTPEEDALLEKLIFNPVPEYGGILEKEEEEAQGGETAEKKDLDGLADLARSINKAPEKEKAVKEGAPKTQEGALTLELAKIFVKQGHFERAYDIISKIILNNPEKSVYFADQLRFLKKLIKIQQSKI